MKYSKIFMSAALVSLMAGSANAATETHNSNWYAGIIGDVSWIPNSGNAGGVNTQLGYRFDPDGYGAFRLEGELGYHKSQGDRGFRDTKYYTYMGNLYYDAADFAQYTGNGWHLAPYIGAGAGYATAHTATATHDWEHVFAWQGMAGLSLVSDAVPGTDWLVGYRYFSTNNVQGKSIHANNLQFGARFNF